MNLYDKFVEKYKKYISKDFKINNDIYFAL